MFVTLILSALLDEFVCAIHIYVHMSARTKCQRILSRCFAVAHLSTQMVYIKSSIYVHKIETEMSIRLHYSPTVRPQIKIHFHFYTISENEKLCLCYVFLLFSFRRKIRHHEQKNDNQWVVVVHSL